MSVFHFQDAPEPPPKIQAISNVRMEAKPELEPELRDFYEALLGLPPAEGEAGSVCFETERLQIQIRLTPDAQPSPMRRRLVLQVPSLEKMEEHLQEAGVPYEFRRGMQFTDQRIFLLDPADNRIELKQTWPF